MLSAYVERTRSVRTTDQLFVSLDCGHDYDSILPDRQASAGICGGTFNTRCGCVLGSTERSACPQCRKQVRIRHINRLFFDIHGEEEGSSADPESLQNELNGMKAVLSTKETRWTD
ncbi:E3 ubiquitin-protein ligase TRAIP-like [Oncorhynchus tshawytscha]|uniref:E3 ubiquitin-protein ligase TRAIP-like n=1 Tax=Oncorhynchus tshawytscha TaxID=74940 RepID=UPI001C3DB25F|nr:E3 ubiquitin-protein ligase TRAIP-like [Oncorhynchus tshawytscha]